MSQQTLITKDETPQFCSRCGEKTDGTYYYDGCLKQIWSKPAKKPGAQEPKAGKKI